MVENQGLVVENGDSVVEKAENKENGILFCNEYGKPKVNANKYLIVNMSKNTTCYPMEHKIDYHWDEEAKVWTATAPDVPGLVLEAEDRKTLEVRIREAIPELQELNGKIPGQTKGLPC